MNNSLPKEGEWYFSPSIRFVSRRTFAGNRDAWTLTLWFFNILYFPTKWREIQTPRKKD